MKKWIGYEKGVNLGGWLSQCDYSKERLEHFIEEEDIKRLSTWGLDHLRLPMDYNVLREENGTFKKDGFDYVKRAVEWCCKYGLNVILEESFEDTASVFPKEREFLFSGLERLKTEDIFEQYSPDSPLFEKPIFSMPASSYHFIAHIFADTIMVDRDAAIRHLRHYPLRREVKGITRALVESLLRAAPPESSVADKAAAVPLCERSPQDGKLVFRIPGAVWEGRPDAAVRDAMKEKYPLSVIAYVLLYWCGPQKSETGHRTPQGRKTHVGRLLAGKEYRDDKSYRNLMDMLLKEAETYTIIKA